MACVCSVCLGSGQLLQDVCPLCDGAAFLHDSETQFVVCLLSGQSNMVGRGVSTELDQTLINFIDERAEVYMAYDIDKSGKEQGNTTSREEFLPMGRETQWSAGGECYTHGPEWGIVQRLLERGVVPQVAPGGKKPRIYLIKYAMGSSTLHEHWSPEGEYFPQLISFTKTMLQKIAEVERAQPRIDGCFWNQGDSDCSSAVRRDAYKSNFIIFVRRLWEELGVSSSVPFPFVPLELHWRFPEAGACQSKSNKRTWSQITKLNEAFRDACQELGPAARVSTITREMVDAIAFHFQEDGHSGTGSLLLEGHHLADTLADLLLL